MALCPWSSYMPGTPHSNVTHLADTILLILDPRIYAHAILTTAQLRTCYLVCATLHILSREAQVDMVVIGGGKYSLNTPSPQL